MRVENQRVETNQVKYHFLTSETQARAALAELGAISVVGLDTETCWERNGKQATRLSLLQIAPTVGDVLVIDVLAVGAEAARDFIESGIIIKAAHNARFDQGVLAGAGLRPDGLIDTLYLSRAALALPSYSLKSVAAHLLAKHLDKTLQKSDWHRRPLTSAQLQYAADDASITLEVYLELQKMLRERGDWERVAAAASLGRYDEQEAVAKKRRVAAKLPPLQLSAEGRQIAAHLKNWRLEKARNLHVPAYMICTDRTLEHLAHVRPETPDALGDIYGLGASRIASFGDELLEVLKNFARDPTRTQEEEDGA